MGKTRKRDKSPKGKRSTKPEHVIFKGEKAQTQAKRGWSFAAAPGPGGEFPGDDGAVIPPPKAGDIIEMSYGSKRCPGEEEFDGPLTIVANECTYLRVAPGTHIIVESSQNALVSTDLGKLHTALHCRTGGWKGDKKLYMSTNGGRPVYIHARNKK